MMFRLAAFGLCATLLTNPVFAYAGQSVSLTRTLTGKNLMIEAKCSQNIEIEPDAQLTNQVELTATAGTQAELDSLTFHDGDHIAIAQTDRCPPSISAGISIHLPGIHIERHGQEFVVKIRVPIGFPIDLKSSGSGDVTIGTVNGPLAATISGSGNLSATETGDTTLKITGSADVTLHHIAGALTLLNTGNADISVQSGTIAPLSIKSTGSGDVSIDAVINGASISNSGSGDINLAHVKGPISQKNSGSGSVTFKQVD